MNNQSNERAPRWRAMAFLLISCSLFGAAMPPRQEEDDQTRRLWNKQFLDARERAKKNRPASQPQAAKAKLPAAVKPAPKPQTAVDEIVDGELIGVTIWRLSMASAGTSAGASRLLTLENGQNTLERVAADTPFQEGQLLRISVEAPRVYDNYLYVIDREAFKDNQGERLGEPYLIFPSRSTPPGGNEISAGRSVYVPAQGDPAPYFALQRGGANHVGEMLTILISPKPLPINIERPDLDLTMVARWERQCGGQTERREAIGGAGKQRTKAEQEADEGKRKLVQTDPLPQTIYRVRAKQDGCAMVTIPLRMAP
jgi:hypothetical protein